MKTVQDVAKQFIQDGFMFTAWDVTKTLRANGEKISHKTVKEAVSKMFQDSEMGIYMREIVDLGISPNPFCYFHPSCDINSYSQDWLENNPTQKNMKAVSAILVTSATSATPVNTSIITYTDVSDVEIKSTVDITLDGRINISPLLLQTIRLNKNESYNIYKNNTDDSIYIVNNYLTLTLTGINDNISILESRTVNSDGRVRLHINMFDNCLNGDETINILTDSKNKYIKVSYSA